MIDLGRIIRTGLALSAAWLTLQATAQNASDATLQLLTYKIKAGDTLHKIASAYLIDGVNIERVAQINQIKDLDLILAGAELQLPKAFVKFAPTSATVMSLSCAGAILLDHSVALKLGQKVIEGAVIDVPPECHISLVIEDGSVIRLPSSASVKLVSLKKNLLQTAPEVKLELVKGRVELEVHKGRGKYTPFEVQTPISIMGVRGTEFRVGYSDQEQTGQVEVLEGGVQAQGTSDTQSQLVAMGYGAPISREGRILAIEKLLEAPTLDIASTVEGSQNTYLIRLKPLDNASYYLADSSPNANAFGERNPEHMLAPEFLTAGLSPQAVFYQFKAVSPNALMGKQSHYAFCATEKDSDKCSALFDTPLANGAPISFVLQKQVQGQQTDVINVNNLLARKGRFSIQGLLPGKYNWVLTYTAKSAQDLANGLTQVTQVGEFELIRILP